MGMLRKTGDGSIAMTHTHLKQAICARALVLGLVGQSRQPRSQARSGLNRSSSAIGGHPSTCFYRWSRPQAGAAACGAGLCKQHRHWGPRAARWLGA